VHLQPAFADLGYHRGSFPVAESAAARILSLPLYPGITPDDQERVVTELARALT
jgi:dTDP-4-amino-4,6-dideoxygalactose transaminase